MPQTQYVHNWTNHSFSFLICSSISVHLSVTDIILCTASHTRHLGVKLLFHPLPYHPLPDNQFHNISQTWPMFPLRFHCLCLTTLLLICSVLQHSPLWYPWCQPCFFPVYSLYYSWNLLMSLLDWHWSIATNYPRIKLCNMVSKALHHLVSISHHPIMKHSKPLQFLLISVGLGKDTLSAYNDYWLTPFFPSGVILGDRFLHETLNDLHMSWVAPKSLPTTPHVTAFSFSPPFLWNPCREELGLIHLCILNTVGGTKRVSFMNRSTLLCYFLFSVPRMVPDTE